MRASSLSSAPALIVAVTAFTAGCSTTIVGGGGLGGAGGEAPDTTSSSSSGWMTTTSVASSSSGNPTGGCGNPTPVGLPPGPCTPTSPACGADSSQCLATAHALGSPQFGLRVAHITLSAPKAFTAGIVKSVFTSSTEINLPACNLAGQGTFNWLLRVDATAGTVTIGGAKPTADPQSGYAFVNGPLMLGNQTFPVAPITVGATLDPNCGLSTSPGDVFLPFYGDLNGTTFTIFPLRSLRFTAARVTPDHDCIGAFNTQGIDPINGCMPDDQHQTFLDGGQFSSFMTLEDADQMLVGPLNESLCVLLTGDAAMFGDGASPQKCKRDAANQILFKGDWCGATNGPGGCGDSVQFAGSFAASGVKIQ